MRALKLFGVQYCHYIGTARERESGVACVLRRNAVDVEVDEGDLDARVVAAVEQIVALDVARVQTGIVGRRQRAVPRRRVVERERTV